jgi:hypothetical protein
MRLIGLAVVLTLSLALAQTGRGDVDGARPKPKSVFARAVIE